MSARLVPLDDLDTELTKVGIDPRSLPIFQSKAEILMVRLIQTDARGANILKQLFLSSGGDVAINWEIARFTQLQTDALCMGTLKMYREVIRKLTNQPYFGLEKISLELSTIINRIGKTYPKQIMGILNVTPDSFSDGGKFVDLDLAVEQALLLVRDGADIIDIGGESTRPGAAEVDTEQELVRVVPVIEKIRRQNESILISIDTSKPEVAKEAVQKGANIVNSIHINKEMLSYLATITNPFVIMHMRGTPKTMQFFTNYHDLIDEMLLFFEVKIEECLQMGINIDRIIVDPGIGFSKTPEQNLQILHHISSFKIFGLPILLGHSRKSFFGKIWQIPLEERDIPTALLSMVGFERGASIIRVHRVKENALAKTMFEQIRQNA